MKIAINCQFCFQKGASGIKEYIINLTNHLEKVDHENEYVLYVLVRRGRRLSGLGRDLQQFG